MALKTLQQTEEIFLHYFPTDFLNNKIIQYVSVSWKSNIQHIERECLPCERNSNDTNTFFALTWLIVY